MFDSDVKEWRHLEETQKKYEEVSIMAFVRKSVSLKDVNVVQADLRSLPVVFLIDKSGSMNEIISEDEMVKTGEFTEVDEQVWEIVKGGKSKMQVLNESMQTMIEEFKNNTSLQAEIYCHVITFGDKSSNYIELSPASDIEWSDITADGSTDMAGAFDFANRIIDDKEKINSRSYRPMIVMVTDGKPNEGSDWKSKLDKLTGGRGGKCERLVLAIGSGDSVDRSVLKQFVSNEKNIFDASDAEKITSFFNVVTMSVNQRSTSANLNEVPSYEDLYDLIED